MAKKAYIGVPSYTVIIENTMTYSSDGEWSWGLNTSNEVNWTKGNTYVCNVEIDGVVYPNLTFAPDVGASWFATYSENGEEVFGVYVSANNQLYDYNLGLDTAVSHTIRLSSGSLDGAARKIKKGYIGIENKARKIKKAYIGIGGVARPCWSGGRELTYYGQITELSSKRRYLASTTLDNKALFGGGQTGQSSYTNTLDVYDASLTRTSTTMGYTAAYAAATAFEDSHAIFRGGYNSDGYTTAIYSINKSLTKSSMGSYTSHTNRSMGATTLDKYAIFAGGMGTGGNVHQQVTAFNKDNTFVTGITNLNGSRYDIPAATVGNYAIFGQGTGSTTDAYTTDLTKVTVTNATSTMNSNINNGVSAGKYAIFGGGMGSGGLVTDRFTKVDAYDENLTLRTLTPFSDNRRYSAGAFVNGFTIFAGGASGQYDNAPLNTVDVYDESLTRISGTPLYTDRLDHCGARAGEYVIFAGGSTSTSWSYVTQLAEAFAVK